MGQEPTKEEESQLDHEVDELRKRMLGMRFRKDYNSKNENYKFSTLNVLVMGLQHAGKSSLINTILRVLNKDGNGPLRIYAIPGNPRADRHGTQCYDIHEPLEGNGNIRLFDCKAPDIGTENAKEEENFYDECLKKGALPFSEIGRELKKSEAHKIHAVIIVISCEHLMHNQFKTALKNISERLSLYNTKPVVVLTMGERLSKKELSDHETTAKSICNSEFVFYLSNYIGKPYSNVKRNKYTDQTVVQLVNTLFDVGDQKFKAEFWVDKGSSKEAQDNPLT